MKTSHELRAETLAKHGFVEGYAWFPAKADFIDHGTGITGVRVATKKTVAEHVPPTTIASVDRWAEDE